MAGTVLVLVGILGGCEVNKSAPPPPRVAPPAFLSQAQGKPVTLDLSDGAQRAFLMAQLDGTPFTAAATPQLHKQLAAMGAPPASARSLRQMQPPPENEPVDLLDLTNVSSDGDGSVQATGIASAVGRSSFVHAVLRLVDADSGAALGPPVVASSFTGVDAHVTAHGKVARGQRAQALFTAIYSPYSCPAATIDCVPRPGQTLEGVTLASPPALTAKVSGAPYAQVMAQTLPGAGAPSAEVTSGSTISPANPPQVTAPVTPVDGGITVCLGRIPGSQPTLCNPDGGVSCTYCDSTQGASATPYLRLPVSGTVNLRYATSTTPKITAFSSYVVPANGGGCTQFQTTSSSNQFTTLNNGLTVRWAYGTSNYDVPNWAQYGKLTSGSNCWTNTGGPINFTFNFTVQDVQGNSVPIVITDFGSPSSNTAVTRPTTFAYGCLAAGTPVLLGDGKSLPVEKLVAGATIRSDAAGTRRRIANTYTGSEYLPLVRFATANGFGATVTAGHPIIAANHLVVLARRLRIGDSVITLKGPAKVTKVESVPPAAGTSVRVYNLDVGDSVGAKPVALTDANRTFWAGGVLVGDNVIQHHEGDRVQLAATAGGELPVPKEWSAEYRLAIRLAGHP